MASPAADTSDLPPPAPPTVALDMRKLQEHWEKEMKTARKGRLEQWHKEAWHIIRRFTALDDRASDRDTPASRKAARVNLFSANVITQRALLYGQTPRVDVKRRYDDPDDDVARVAATMINRILNLEIQKGTDGYTAALTGVLDDRLLPGLGNAKIRYEVEFKPDGTKASEYACVDYVSWEDQAWSAARTWGEVRWWGFRNYMSEAAFTKRFGKDAAKKAGVQFSTKKDTEDKASKEDRNENEPWARAEVWEIWSKEDHRVYWYSPNASALLDVKEDPLQLAAFFPSPRPLIANGTTSDLFPAPDFRLSKDLYNEVDRLTTRIKMLTRAVKVTGMYDKASQGLQRMLDEGTDNQLFPVDNWAMFAEKGGVQGLVSWLPLEAIIATLDKLRDIRSETIQLVFQASGLSDIVRGEATEGTPATAAESKLKAKFASTRVQFIQNEFVRFASELQALKAEVICKHFSPETIVAQSNVMFTADKEYAEDAVKLMKMEEIVQYRIEVLPESISLPDYAALKSERLEVLSAISAFFQGMTPFLQTTPDALPQVLELLKWTLAGVRGAANIESVLDKAIVAAQKAAAAPKPPPQPPPDVQKAEILSKTALAVQDKKGQIELAKLAAQAKSEAAKLQLEQQSEAARMALEAEADARRLAVEAEAEAQRLGRELQAEAERVRIEAQAEAELLAQKQAGESDLLAQKIEGDKELMDQEAELEAALGEPAIGGNAGEV